MNSLQEKVVLITGGGTGIGRATAVAFARNGAKLVIAGRRAAEGAETVRQAKAAGAAHALFLVTDVSREEDVKALVASTVSEFGRLDVAFNNAGTEGDTGPLVSATEENYHRIMDTNVKGMFFSLKHQIPAMLANGGGSIINNASVAGLVGMPTAALYVASKHAVMGLTRTVALEVARQGIRVNAVSPGAIETDMVTRFTGGQQAIRDYMVSMHPVGRLGLPEEIASAVLWLASDGASFITGQSITLDGGWTAQ